MAVSQLIQDLGSVPNIVSSLGLSIASAQKALDSDYLDGVERIIAMAKSILGNGIVKPDGTPFPEALAFIQDMLTKLAPSRYQFTETTLSVRMDLAQSLKFSGSVGLGFGVGAISINAAFTIGYSYDYQAAAQCQTVLHAYPPDATIFNALLSRAATINGNALALPPRSQVDQAIIDQNTSILNRLTGQQAAPIVTKPTVTSLIPASGKSPITGAITVNAVGFDSGAKVNILDSSNPPNKVETGLAIASATATSFQITIPAPGLATAGIYQLQIVNSDGTTSDATSQSQFSAS